MTLLYKLTSGLSKSIWVPFDPLLSKYDDAKPRLLSMKAEALEGLGMVCVRRQYCFQSAILLIHPL